MPKTLTDEQYYNLKRCESLLQCLKEYGVDNWEGYGEALKQHHRDCKGTPWADADDDRDEDDNEA